MSKCQSVKKLFTDAYYQQLDLVDKSEFDNHISDCPSCGREFEEYKMTLDQMKQWHRPEPAKDFETKLWRKIQSEINDISSKSNKNVLNNLFSEIRWHPRLKYSFALAAIMLITGIMIGKFILTDPINNVVRNTIETNKTAAFTRAESYINKSKVLLLGIMNHDPIDQTGISHQKSISRSLIKEAAVIKNELKESEDKIMAHLISELEVILMQIANLEETYDLESVELIQSGIERKGILFKINVNQMIQGKKENPGGEKIEKDGT